MLLRMLEHTTLGRRSLWGYGSVHSVLIFELPENFCVPLSLLIWSLTCRTEASFAMVQYLAKGRGHYFRKILWVVWLEKLVLVCFSNSLANCFKTWTLGHFAYGFQINSSLYGVYQPLPGFLYWWPLVNWVMQVQILSWTPRDLYSDLDGRKVLLCAGIQCWLVLVFLFSVTARAWSSGLIFLMKNLHLSNQLVWFACAARCWTLITSVLGYVPHSWYIVALCCKKGGDFKNSN